MTANRPSGTLERRLVSAGETSAKKVRHFFSPLIGRLETPSTQKCESTLRYEDHAKYKELAAADTIRYKKETKDFYECGLASSQGHNPENEAKGSTKSSEVVAGTPFQLSNPSNQEQQPAAAVGIASHLLPQVTDLLQLLNRQPSSSSAAGMTNPSPNLIQQNLAGIGGGSSTRSHHLQVMPSTADDQIIRRLLQQLSTRPSTHNESVLRHILYQKSTIEQHRQKMIQEMNMLRLWDAQLDARLANEMSNQPNTNGIETLPTASSISFGPASADRGDDDGAHMNSLLTEQHQLSLLLQMQTRGASLGTLSQAPGFAAPAPILTVHDLLGWGGPSDSSASNH